MISIVGVTKSYPLGPQRIDALRNITVEVRRGEFAVILGRSGAGKSTLLGIMGGLLRPSQGQVVLGGHSIWDISEKARARFRARQIGFVFQNAPVIGALSVLENVLLANVLARTVSVEARARATDLIASMDLGEKIEAFPEQLSGGEKRRIAIASALMNDPPVLIADEPTGDLDVETELLILEHFVRRNRMGATIVMVTHNRRLAKYANRLFTMDGGQLVECPQDADRADTFEDAESAPCYSAEER